MNKLRKTLLAPSFLVVFKESAQETYLSATNFVKNQPPVNLYDRSEAKWIGTCNFCQMRGQADQSMYQPTYLGITFNLHQSDGRPPTERHLQRAWRATVDMDRGFVLSGHQRLKTFEWVLTHFKPGW